jgi:simple sugar transport system permease protein
MSAVVGYSIHGLHAAIHIPLAVLAGALLGAIWALLPGLAYAYLQLNELVTTVMMNYIGLLLVEYLIRFHFHEPFQGDAIPNWVATPVIDDAAKIPLLFPPHEMHWGLFFGIGIAVMLALVYRTALIGFEADMLGLNRRFAFYGGVRSKRILSLLFVISGALGGIVGAFEVQGSLHVFSSTFPKGLGFDGITVALLSQNSPLAAIPASLFVAMLRNGSYHVERLTNVNRAAISVIQALILLFFTAHIWLPKISEKFNRAEAQSDR